MDNVERLRFNVARLPAQEANAVRETLLRLCSVQNPDLQREILASVAEVVACSARAASRRQSRHSYEVNRRITVAARVPEEIYKVYQAAAGSRSMYRFVIDACDAEARRVGLCAFGRPLNR